VRTLLNSGNVVFGGRKEKPGAVATRIQRGVAERLGVESRVSVLTGDAFATAVKENPLADLADNPSRFLLAFCDDPGRLKLLTPLMQQKWGREALAVGTHAAYLWCAEGILESRLLGEVWKVLGESTTTRNWATALKIQAAL
jgi:uncharacterized protein (DUF1697 family)